MSLPEITDQHAKAPANDTDDQADAPVEGELDAADLDVADDPESSLAAAAAARDQPPRISTCYSMALALDAFVARTAAEAPRTHAWLADHAQRASATLVLHLAESVSRSGEDRAGFLTMARASALEVDAALTLLAHRGVCTRQRRREARDVTMRLVASLGRLAD